MSGDPEYAKFYEDNPDTRWRRHNEAAVLNPDRFCKHTARRAEMQFSGDWTALAIAGILRCDIKHYEMPICLLVDAEPTANLSLRPLRSLSMQRRISLNVWTEAQH